MEIEMERELKNILTEVLVFPYEQDIVTSLEDACSKYVEEITLSSYEDCVLHLCLDIPAVEMIQKINKQTGKKFPNRVYRALAGYVVGESLAIVTDDDDKVMFLLALRNVLKAKTDDADGIISKSIDPASFASVESYWATHNVIPSLRGRDIVTTVFDTTTWAQTGLDIEDCYTDIQALAKFYCREQFKQKYSTMKVSNNQDIYVFANHVADEIASQDWLFTAENPGQTLKDMGIKGSAISLYSIKTKIRGGQNVINDDIEAVSVYRRYLYANDYEELGTKRISPLNFAIAIFYESLYERLKSENYE